MNEDMEYQDFYNSEDAAKMVAEYNKLKIPPLPPQYVKELLNEADDLENLATGLNSFLFRRRKMRLEIKLQQKLLDVLLVLSPEEQELGKQTYDRLSASIGRVYKLC